MLLADAFELFKSAKPMSRLSWNENDGYVVLMPGMSHLWKVILKPQPNAGNYIMSFDDLYANDWSEYDASRFVVKAQDTEQCAV